MDALPTELIQEILLYFKTDMVSPTIAEEATWKHLYGIPNWWSRKTRSQDGAETDDYNPKGHLTSHYKTVLPLRLVNRLFNEFLTPFIYQELNLFELNDEIDYEVATRYGTHIRILRIRLAVKSALSNESRLIEILSLCSSVQSVGLYHPQYADSSSSSSSSSEASPMAGLFSSISKKIRSIGHRHKKSKGTLPSPSPQTTLVEAITSSIQSKQLRSIGFYYPRSYNRSDLIDGSNQNLLYEVATSDQAKVIKRLDVYFGSISADMYTLLRTRFTGLEALTIRKTLDMRAGPLWIPGAEDSYWGAYSNLTSLQLVGCDDVYPPHIAELIRHFPSLEYFLISACGNGPITPPGRSKGWSSRQDEWWNQRKPLKLMHIEHMLTWEMLVMGTIPVLEIRAVSLHAGDLAKAFMDDGEIFPHLRLLRVEPLDSRAFRGNGARRLELELESDLRKVCDARKIEFRRDASWLIHNRYYWW